MKTYFSNNKWLIGIIAFLVVLNLLTLSMFWFSNQGSQKNVRDKKVHKRGQMDKFFAKKLDLSNDQQEQLKAFYKAHRQSVKASSEKMDQLRKQRMEVLTQATPDTLQLNDLALQIGMEQTQMEKLLSNHYFELYAMCNEEQKEKLGKVFQKLGKRMGHKKKRTKEKRN